MTHLGTFRSTEGPNAVPEVVHILNPTTMAILFWFISQMIACTFIRTFQQRHIVFHCWSEIR